METPPDHPLTFDALVKSPPLIHSERTITWAIHPVLAKFLDEHVEPGMATLETGAGLSTLVILRKGPRLHIAIQPNADEFAAITEFAAREGIDTRAFRPAIAPSQHYLPTADLPALDLVLVDGDHSFPAPFVDWYYTAEQLRVGGLMIVDDIQIGTGAILASFLSADPKWEPILVEPQRFAIYRKLADFIHEGSWMAQPFLYEAFPTAGVRLLRPETGDRPSETGEEPDPAHQLERVRAELDWTKNHLSDTRQQLEQTRELLRASTGEHDTAADTAPGAVEQAPAMADRVQAMVDRIHAMESSKFWKLRGVWFRVRRIVGLPGTE